MLRLFVLLLVLMNGAYFAWSQGFFQSVGLAPEKQSEPERLFKQIKPDALQLLNPEALKKLLAEPPVGLRMPECLQAGFFSLAQAVVLRSALAANPGVGNWALDSVADPARWMVYMGDYANADELAKKKGQLVNLHLKFETLVSPASQFGLSLGHYPSQAGANAALEKFKKNGVRTAKVMLDRAETPGLRLQIKTSETTSQAQLDALKPALGDKALTACS